MEETLWEGKPFYLGLPSFTTYKVTNQRIIIETGILTKCSNEVELFRVRDLSTKRNLFERLIGVGDIEFISTDASLPNFSFQNLREYEKVKELVRNAVREQRNAQKIEIPGY